MVEWEEHRADARWGRTTARISSADRLPTFTPHTCVTAINGELSQLPLWVILDLFATLGYEPVALAKQRGCRAMVPFVNRTIPNCEHILAVIHNNTFAIHCAHLVPNFVGTTIDGGVSKVSYLGRDASRGPTEPELCSRKLCRSVATWQSTVSRKSL